MNIADNVIGSVYRKDYSALKRLLTPGDVNARDVHGFTPLMHAVLAENADPRTVGYLIHQGADVNAAESEKRWTALHFAARDQNTEIVRLLLDSGAEVDPVDTFGDTPLWHAAMTTAYKAAVIEMLLAHGADSERKNKYDVSPKDIARDSADAELLALLDRKR
jgi:uncharacterized protein